ncbi:MAG: hypothetical protein ACRDPE_15150 [Solirubrobacterales bacterium]
MADETEVGPASPSARKDPNDPASGLPEGAPESLADAARGREINAAGESEALDFLLGRTQPLLFDVPVKFDTDKGQKKLTLVVRQLDGARILAIEKENRKGDGPFAELDDVACNAAMVAEACVAIVDETAGVEVDPQTDRFVGGAPGGVPMAFQVRFKYQSGLLDGVTAQIRSVSGYNPSRVESANRSIRDAVGGS